MLYDPKWNKPEVKADPFTLESLIAWLEMQPGEKTYNWFDIKDCLACKYLEAAGIEEPWGKIVYTTIFGSEPAYHEIAGTRPWTFGAALSRARARALART